MFKFKSTKKSPDPNDPIYARMVEHEITIQRNKQTKQSQQPNNQLKKNNNNSTKKIVFNYWFIYIIN